MRGQASWEIATPTVQAWVTEMGGMVGPVRFRLGDRVVEPLHVAPWADEPPTDVPPIIQALRGDFFCLPFGGNERPFEGERHPIHGETANARWSLVNTGPGELTTSLDTTIRPGRVTKTVRLDNGHPVLYQEHLLSGFSGPMGFGHHAMLSFPPDETGLFATSPFGYGQVFPGEFEKPANGGYTSLLPGGRFSSLSQVPLENGEFTGLSAYPAREGFEDLAMIFADPREPLAWNAVTFPNSRYVWVSLRDSGTLSGTVLWHSNGGRHYHPWNGRHRRVLGVEDVTAYFHFGLAESADRNPASDAGFRTSVDFLPDVPLAVRTAMLVAEVPGDFGRVASVAERDGGIAINSESGESILAQVDIPWILGSAKPTARMR